MATPTELLNEYNRLFHSTMFIRNQSKKHPVNGHKLNVQKTKILEELDEMCREIGADPKLWIYTLFKKRHFRYPPKFNELCSRKHERYYNECSVGATFTNHHQRVRNEERRAKGELFDPARDLSATREARKRRLLVAGQLEQCFHDTEMGGYHPASSVCGKCAFAHHCYYRVIGLYGEDEMRRRGESVQAR